MVVHVVDCTCLVVIVRINQTSLFPGQSLLLYMSTLRRLVEMLQRMRIDEAKTLSKKLENFRLLANTNLLLALVEFFETEVDL
jgi:hypothetical protein